MTSFASVVIGSRPRQECNLLFQWAESDLQRFLDGDYLPGATSQSITPRYLFSEAAGIATALSYLHTNLYDKYYHQHIQLCHLDLKPNNILLQVDPKHPHGKWKLTDFGISSVTRSSQPMTTRDLFVRTAVRTSSQAQENVPQDERVPGPYQPPETEPQLRQALPGSSQHHKSDVWSFGCVLLTVLLFSIGGSSYVEFLRNALMNPKADPDGKWRSGRFYRSRRHRPELCPSLINWVQPLANNRSDWVPELWKSIQEGMLNVIPGSRDDMAKIWAMLYRIVDVAGTVNEWPGPPLPDLQALQQQHTTRINTSSVVNEPAVFSGNSLPLRTNLQNPGASRPPLRAPSPLPNIEESPGASADLLVPAGVHIAQDDPSPSYGTGNSSITNASPLPTDPSAQMGRTIQDGAKFNIPRYLAKADKSVGRSQILLAREGHRVIYWDDQNAKLFRHTDLGSLFSGTYTKLPPEGSVKWDQICVAGDFVLLRQGPRSASSNGIVRIMSSADFYDLSVFRFNCTVSMNQESLAKMIGPTSTTSAVLLVSISLRLALSCFVLGII
jgi:serine/threonine protein kinase